MPDDRRHVDAHDADLAPTASGATPPAADSADRSSPDARSGGSGFEAAALTYDPAHGNAPRMVARGRGRVADRIMELAREHDVPVRRDPTLVSILGALEVGSEIPADLYGVIAEVLAWAYHTDKLAGTERARRRAA